MHAMHKEAKPDQARRIRRAIEKAVMRRDRYTNAHVAELTKALKTASDDVAKQIRRFEEKVALKPWQEMRLTILKDLEKEIDGVAAELQTNWKLGIRASAERSLKLGIEDGIGQLEAMEVPNYKDLTDVNRNALITRTFSTIDRAAVDFLANYEVQLLGSVSTELASGIKGAITNGVLTGKSIPEVARDIGKVVDDPEEFKTAGKTIFKTVQQRATLIARTETLRAHNEGAKVFYREVGVKKVKWSTAHDEQACPECAPLDGRVFELAGFDGPPRHPNCKCTISAWMD